MRRGGGADKCILMTVYTTRGAAGGYQSAVIRGRGMDRAPRRAVTACTVATRGEVLGVGAVRRYQAAVGIMTVHTTRMRIRCCTPKRVVMARSTVGTRLE
jgi:hypothetical protein